MPFMARYLHSRVTGYYTNLLLRIPVARSRLIVVNEYPKSGGTWVANMLADLLRRVFSPHRMYSPASAIVHGHFKYSGDLKNVVLVLRDGRDVMVSYYYHCLFENEMFNRLAVKEHRRMLTFSDYNDIQANLPRFIEYSYTKMTFPPFSWSGFCDQWMDAERPIARYEDLLIDPLPVLRRIVHELTAEEISDQRINEVVRRHSFERLSGRQRGKERANSFLRKGVAGDWKNKFSKEARQCFGHYGGRTLIELGYEADLSWV